MVCDYIDKQILVGVKYIATMLHKPLKGKTRNQCLTPKYQAD